jgi:hypothetical protein
MDKLFERPKKKNYDEFYQDRKLFPDTLRNFVAKYYEINDYQQFMEDFKRKNAKLISIGTDLRHQLWIAHLEKILRTTMVYPDGTEIKVQDLPRFDLLRLIDFFGYEINMGGFGHGNDTLLGIFKRYYSHFFPE